MRVAPFMARFPDAVISIPKLESAFSPAGPVQSDCTIRLGNPFLDVTLVTLHVKEDL